MVVQQTFEVVLDPLLDRERPADQPPESPLLQAFGRRIDRRQRSLGTIVACAEAAVLRMHHFEPRRPRPHLAEASQGGSLLQAFLLLAREVKEAQRNAAGAIGETAKQRPAAPVSDLAECDLTLDENPFAGPQAAEGPDDGAVLIAQRNEAKEIADGLDTEPVESRRMISRPTPGSRAAGSSSLVAELLNRFDCKLPIQPSSTMIASISICTWRGSAATPIAARAG